MAYINNPLAFRTITGAEDFTPEEQILRENAKNIGQQIVEEGCVLLKNDGTLPLQTERVNVFGAVAANPFFGGRGSACADNSFAIGFFTALEEVGICYHQPLYNLYKNWAKKGRASLNAYPKEHTVQRFRQASVLSTVVEVFSAPYIKELPAAKLTDSIMQEAAEFSDVALVILGRSGSEQHDMKPEELRLFASERAMLDRVCSYFDKVIVLINTADVIELGFLEEYPQIRAALSIGFPARTGMGGVARILKGEVSPSGRTVDTWYYRTDEHPAFLNSGTFCYKNAKKRHFLMYKEDIYVGYRYAETFLNQESYRNKVQFPFGYGLSYTDFCWENVSLQVQDQVVQIQLKVTNTGSYAGKDVIQIYIRPPYTGKIEKPKKVLAAFAKTATLAPGQSETVSLSIPLYDIASYDTANGCYVYRIIFPKAIASGDGENLVVCIGDSITYGQGVMNSRDVDSYPAQLAELLGDNYQVINYGLPNRTLQSTGNMPYPQESFYEESLTQDADIVIIMLGSNDSKPDFWNASQYEEEYTALIAQYQSMASNPAVFIMIPPAIFLEEPDSGDCSDEIVREELIPILKRISEETGAALIDLYSLTENHPEWYADGLHPTKEGNEAIAQEIYKAITIQ